MPAHAVATPTLLGRCPRWTLLDCSIEVKSEKGSTLLEMDNSANEDNDSNDSKNRLPSRESSFGVGSESSLRRSLFLGSLALDINDT